MTDSYHFESVAAQCAAYLFTVRAAQVLEKHLSFPSGAIVLTDGSNIVGRVAPEPIRPALDWNTATPFDTFGDDFIVTKGAVEAPPTPSPTTDSAYPAIAGLLRVSDGGPANASASLLLKTA